MNANDPYSRYQALWDRLGDPGLDATEVSAINADIDATLRDQTEDAVHGAAILELQVRPCEGKEDLRRYVIDLGTQAATNAARQREDELMGDFFASIRSARKHQPKNFRS